MSAIFEKEYVRVNLSNTESVGSSIYNYSDLQRTKASSTSSTASYFLSTNNELSNKILSFIDCDNSSFIVDILKTRQYINSIDNLLKNYNVKDFHGELKDYFNYKDYYFSNDSNFDIGFAKTNIEEGSTARSYLRFNNDDENVKKFRGIIIAIFSSIIIEKKNGKNYIYPVIKREVLEMIHEKTKDGFKKYMTSVKKLSESSIEQYIEYVDISSDDAIYDGILDKSIYEYSDPNDVRDILETLRADDHFNSITFKRNHINTAAIGNYIDFLEYINESSGKTVISNVNENEEQVAFLIKKLRNTVDVNEKESLVKDIIRNCYEMLNHFKN